MTTFPWAGRLLPAALTRAAVVRELPDYLRDLPAALRPVPLDQVPAGWEQRAYDPTAGDADALTWLGFEPGDDAEPLMSWPRPERWPARRNAGRHRAGARLQTA